VEASRKKTPVSTRTMSDGSGTGATLREVPDGTPDTPVGLLGDAPDSALCDGIPDNMPVDMPVGANAWRAMSESVGRLGGGKKSVDISAIGSKSIDVISVAVGDGRRVDRHGPRINWWRDWRNRYLTIEGELLDHLFRRHFVLWPGLGLEVGVCFVPRVPAGLCGFAHTVSNQLLLIHMYKALAGRDRTHSRNTHGE
jgi:hypothetical protein